MKLMGNIKNKTLREVVITSSPVTISKNYPKHKQSNSLSDSFLYNNNIQHSSNIEHNETHYIKKRKKVLSSSKKRNYNDYCTLMNDQADQSEYRNHKSFNNCKNKTKKRLFQILNPKKNININKKRMSIEITNPCNTSKNLYNCSFSHRPHTEKANNQKLKNKGNSETIKKSEKKINKSNIIKANIKSKIERKEHSSSKQKNYKSNNKEKQNEIKKEHSSKVSCIFKYNSSYKIRI